ncbi:MAG: hypothetical protein V4608_02005 [Bacteroidota bacterium]
MKKLIIPVAVTLFFVASCKTTKQTQTPVAAIPATDCNGTDFSYKTDIKPIIEASCLNCHSYNGKGGFDFTILEDVKKAARKGELLGTIKGHKGFPIMPPYEPRLDAASIAKIECWINNGMKD